MSYFAEKVKSLRLELDLSMQDLADKSCVSKSMICKIERDEVQPTLDVAGKLAKALGKNLSEMLHPTQRTQVVVLHQKDQAVWEDADHIVRRNISPVFEGLKTEWLFVKIPSGITINKSVSCTNQPDGEKFILVTQGALDIIINEETYHLEKDDSMYFNASCAHKFYNPGKIAAEYYVVIKHG